MNTKCFTTVFILLMFTPLFSLETSYAEKENTAAKLRVVSVPMFGVHSVEESCKYIIEKIYDAADIGADIVVFPETATNSYQSNNNSDHPFDKDVWVEVQQWIPKIQEAVKKAGRPWVVVGTYRYKSDDKRWNSALVIDPEGTIRAIYDKISEGGAKWLMMNIHDVCFTIVICSDFWVPGILTIPKMLGSQVVLYPHGSGGVTVNRTDWQALYYTRAWESNMFLVMADCSWQAGNTFKRPENVQYPYDFLYHQLNQSCIIDPDGPKYLARAMRDEKNGLLIADIDPSKVKTSDPQKYTVGKPWGDMLNYYLNNGYIEWMK